MASKTVYLFDDEGFFRGPDTVFENARHPGVFHERSDATEVAPPEDQDNFYKWDGAKWNAVPKPKSAAECVGLVISHTSETPHDEELRHLMETLAEGSKDYRVARGEDLSWSVEAIPQEEKLSQEIASELADFDGRIASLKERMAVAMLQGDQNAVESLRTEYKTLMGGE